MGIVDEVLNKTFYEQTALLKAHALKTNSDIDEDNRAKFVSQLHKEKPVQTPDEIDEKAKEHAARYTSSLPKKEEPSMIRKAWNAITSKPKETIDEKSQVQNTIAKNTNKASENARENQGITMAKNLEANKTVEPKLASAHENPTPQENGPTVAQRISSAADDVKNASTKIYHDHLEPAGKAIKDYASEHPGIATGVGLATGAGLGYLFGRKKR